MGSPKEWVRKSVEFCKKSFPGANGGPATLALLAAIVCGLVASPAWAEPYLAIQEGYKCSKCHVNMTGGGKRTDFANIYVQARLAHTFVNWRAYVAKPKEEIDEENPFRTDSSSSFFSPRLNEYIAIGGDARALQEDLNTPNQGRQSVSNQRKQNIYLEVDLIPGRVLSYQTLAGGGDNREIFGLIYNLPYNAYIKAGQFFLPYGLRLQDDTAFIRAVTGFTYGTTDIGMELGLEPGNWTAQLAWTNGTGASLDDNLYKQVTASVAYVRKHFRIGASASRNKPDAATTVEISGVHGGMQFGRVGILTEGDVIEVKNQSEPNLIQFAGIFEINYLISRGMNLKFSWEYHDPDKALFENARTRRSIVFEPFLAQFVQFRAGYRENRGIPQNDAQNAVETFVELHTFF